ncbi:MAG: ATP-binding protein [Clostridiales bacterium]|nr:ATP-binding protein [Clostridiales bacterium]
MSSIYDEINLILENRRIDSEIRLDAHLAEINEKYPDLAEADKKIRELTHEHLSKALDGETDPDMAEKIARLTEKREQLRKSHGLSEKDYETVPFCALCGDTGMVSKEEDGKVFQRPCICICKLLAPTFLTSGGINKYPGVSFEKGNEAFFASNPNAANVYKAVKTLAEHEKVPDMVLFGSSGQGKTFMAVSAARYYAEHGLSSMVIRLADAQELMMEHRKIVQAFYTNPETEKRVSFLKNYLVEAELLVLDDMGVEPKTQNSEADLLYILDSRAQAGKKTIITTNYDLSTLKERYGGRVYERIKRSFKCYSLSPKKEA